MVESDRKEKFYTALSKEGIHQISGWCDECQTKSLWNKYIIRQNISKHLKSSIGDRFPVSLSAPLNSVQLKGKLEELDFLGGGSGGMGGVDNAGDEPHGAVVREVRVEACGDKGSKTGGVR